jgi:ABC-type multidrug transport system fused ATPase/permease subunit
MKEVDKWIDRIYAETDFGRSVATSLAGIIGLVVYAVFNDWVVSAFGFIISFPIVRLVATWLHGKANRAAKRNTEREEDEITYSRLSSDEKDVVLAFVNAGGCVLTWSQVNKLSISSTAVESLIQRELITTSMTADTMRETFVLDTAIFDFGQSKSNLPVAP